MFYLILTCFRYFSDVRDVRDLAAPSWIRGPCRAKHDTEIITQVWRHAVDIKKKNFRSFWPIIIKRRARCRCADNRRRWGDHLIVRDPDFRIRRYHEHRKHVKLFLSVSKPKNSIIYYFDVDDDVSRDTVLSCFFHPLNRMPPVWSRRLSTISREISARVPCLTINRLHVLF